MESALGEKIRKQMVRAINDFDLIDPGDRILAAVSGGKDSTAMLLLLHEIRKRAPFSFTVDAVILDQKQPGFSLAEYKSWLLGEYGIELRVIEEDTYSVVKEKTTKGKSYCGLCSRLRRGILYTYAHRHGYNSIALGHHRDDLNETVLLNMFYGGKIATMAPRLRSKDGRNSVIRPLVYVAEPDIKAFAKELCFPIIPCNLCGSQDGMKRAKIKSMLGEFSKDYDQLSTSLSRSLGNICAEKLLDRRLIKDYSSIAASDVGELDLELQF